MSHVTRLIQCVRITTLYLYPAQVHGVPRPQLELLSQRCSCRLFHDTNDALAALGVTVTGMTSEATMESSTAYEDDQLRDHRGTRTLSVGPPWIYGGCSSMCPVSLGTDRGGQGGYVRLRGLFAGTASPPGSQSGLRSGQGVGGDGRVPVTLDSAPPICQLVVRCESSAVGQVYRTLIRRCIQVRNMPTSSPTLALLNGVRTAAPVYHSATVTYCVTATRLSTGNGILTARSGWHRGGTETTGCCTF